MFVGSYQKDLKTMIVLSLIGTITIILLLNRLIEMTASQKIVQAPMKIPWRQRSILEIPCESNRARRQVYEVTIVQR